MNKFFSMILFFFAISVAQTSAMAPTIKISPLDATVNVDETVTYNVTADNFNHISVEFTVLFDSGKLDFVSYSDINPALTEFNVNYIPPGDPVFPEGVKVSWLDPNFAPKQLPDGAILFKITLKAKAPGGSQITVPCGAPYVCEAIDGSGNVFENFPPAPPASILVNGMANFDNFTLGISNECGPVGSEVCVKVLALNKFDSITLMQMRIEWDVTKLQFKNVKNCNTAINLNCSNDIFFNGTAMFLSWFADPNNAPNGYSLPNGSTLFEICFTVLQPLGTTVPVVFKDEQFSKNEFNNAIGPITDFDLINGSVLSGNCGGAPEKLTLTGSQVVAATGSTACVKITASNFDSLINAKFALTWDKTVLTLSSVQKCNPALSISNCSLGTPEFGVIGGNLQFTWQAPLAQQLTGVTLPNNATLFEVCFTVVGAAGSSTPVNIGSVSGFTASAQDAGKDNFDLAFNPGKVSVPGAGTVTLNFGDMDACPGKTVCIPVKVDGFNNIESMEFAVSWDTTKLKIIGLQNCNPALGITNCTCVGSPNFNCYPVLVTIWVNQNSLPASLPDGSTLYEICFDVIGANGTSSPIQFIPNPNTTALEFLNPTGGALDVLTNDQNIAITTAACNQPCLLTATSNITDVTCKGLKDGTVTINVGGGSGNYTYKWSSPIPIGTGKTASNLSAGAYYVTATDVNNVGCFKVFGPYIVNDATGFTVSANVTAATCTGTEGGAIQLLITGAVGQSYNWDPVAPNSANITNLPSGSWDVTVTSDKGCTEVLKGIVVDKSIPAFNIVGEITFPKCYGDSTGSVLTSITPAGTYTFKWNTIPVQTTPSIFKLPAGVYVITATDGNACSKSASFTIQNPPDITVTIVASNASSFAAKDGSLQAKVTPAGNYTYLWNTVPPQTKALATGLAAATYTVTVTNANGCTKVKSGTVGVDGKVPEPGVTIVNTLADEYNGFGVSCNGVCDGVLAAIPPTKAIPPFLYVWSDNAVGDPDSLALNLCAGIYGVTITDSNGDKYYAALKFNLTAPAPLTLKIVTAAAPTPSATALVTGGVSPYEFKFNSSPFTSSNISEVDGYDPVTIIAKDANNCTVVKTTPGPLGQDCNQARLVITPNGDGINDFFILSCANVYTLNKLTIFDRWGRMLYQKGAYQNDWNGESDKGDPLPEGGYYWAFEYVNANGNIEVAKGSITIVR